MRWLTIVMTLAACGFRSHGDTGGGGDANDAQGDAPHDGVTPPSCDAAASWADGIAPTATVYVDPTATGTEDGTAAHPFRSIANAMPIAPGTRVSLAAGLYPEEELDGVHGTATAPVWIEGPTGVARAQFANQAFGIHLIRPSYVVVRHFDMVNVGAGVNIDDALDRGNVVAHHVVIADIATTNATFGIELSGVYDVTIRDVTTNGGSRGIALVGVHRASIARATIMSASTAAAQISGGSDDVELRQSTLFNAGAVAVWIGGDSAEEQFRPPLGTANVEASNVRVFDNLIERATTIVLCSVCTTSLVASNYILGTPSPTGTRYVVHLDQPHGAINGHAFAPAGTLRLIDNAISVSSNPFGAHGEVGTDAASCTFSHNIWYESENPANSMPNLPSAEVGGLYGVDPAYTTDGHVCGTSAAAHAGVAVPEVLGTLSGACRPDPPTIGPSEPSC